MQKQRGFSLVELMVALAVLVILISVAVPSFTGSLQRANASNLADTLITSLNFAKSESISRNERVYLCARNADGSNCLNNAADWNSGWLVRLSSNDSDLRDVRIGDANAEVSLVDDNGDQSGLRFVFTASGEITMVNALGIETTPANAFFSTEIENCDSPQLNLRRAINIGLSGLITVNADQACQP